MVEDLCPEEMIAQVTPAVSVLSEGAGGARGLGSAELGRRLLLAARHGDTPLVLDLMAKGAPFTTDWLGTSALHAAASGAHVDTCAVLLRAGVSRDCRTKVDRTPLHMAAHAGHAAVAQLLLDNHACVDCRDMLHMTPLHWAAERGHAAAAAALLRHGADPGAVSKFNKTPRSIAQARGRHHILRLIDDALREREAAKSVDELRLANETEESTAIEQQRTAEGTERLTETAAPKPTGDQTHSEPIKIHLERPLGGGWSAEGGGAEGGGGGAGAALLRRHGIAPLPADSGSTVLTALQSGRSVVLSDAGKLMLKESVPLSPGGRGAAPAPPARPVRVFALNNKLRAPPKESKHGRRVLPPHDMQIKFLQVPADKKVPIAKSVEMKAKTKLVPSPPAAPPVKIMMKKANLSKLLPPAAEDHGLDMNTLGVAAELVQNSPGEVLPPHLVIGGRRGQARGYNRTSPRHKSRLVVNEEKLTLPFRGDAAAADKCNQNVVFVPEAFLTNDSPAYLRTQLLAAHRTIASLHAQLARCRARLARHEAP